MRPTEIRRRWHVVQGWYLVHRMGWPMGRWCAVVHTWRTYRLVYGRGEDAS